MQRQIRMNVDLVLRTDQARIVKVAGLEEQSIESSEAMVFRVTIAARRIELRAEPRFPERLPGVSRVEARGPRENRVAVKAAELQNLFGVPIPVLPMPELAGAERVPMFVSGAGSVFPVLSADAEVVEIDSERSRRGEP